jgi:tetrahydromethanopterin S-methyltransferase subunit A
VHVREVKDAHGGIVGDVGQKIPLVLSLSKDGRERLRQRVVTLWTPRV